MSRAKKRTAILSPLAFALAFGAYAETPVTSMARLQDQTAAEASADLDWMIDWIEKSGQA